MALTPDQVTEAKRMRGLNPPITFHAIAARFGVTASTVKADIDPDYKARRTVEIRERRQARAKGAGGGMAWPRKPAGPRPEKVRLKKQPNFATVRHTAAPLVADPPPLPPPDIDDEKAPGVRYMTNNGCRWPLGDRRDSDNLPLCCGETRLNVEGEKWMPYCGHHTRRASGGLPARKARP